MADTPLLPVAEAFEAILDAVPEARTTRVPLMDAVGLVLAGDVFSDVDMPPFPKSMMDGYAVRAADLAATPATLDVVMTIHAGQVPERAVGAGEAAKIMTGAPVPEGADAVVMFEKTEDPGDGRVRILEAVPPGRHVSPPGELVRAGDRVLAAGRPVRAGEVSVLATVGVTGVPVFEPPRVVVFTTGDEVVPPERTPGPGQIRNSNSSTLVARIRRDGGRPEDRGVLPDDLDAIRAGIREALRDSDVVVLTGGVSMGEKDLVAEALAAEGCRRVFHKIRLKPGKPLLFGTAGRTLAFGLPGNPVSVVVTYELLVRPALRRLLGYATVRRPLVDATLAGPPPHALPREQYLPARFTREESGPVVEMLRWKGSADLFGFATGNALIRVPAGGPAPETGSPARVIVLEEEG